MTIVTSTPSPPDRGSLDPQTATLLDSHIASQNGLSVVLFGRCCRQQLTFQKSYPKPGH